MVNFGHNSFNRYLTSNPPVEAMCGTTSSGTSKEPCHLQAKLGEPADFQGTGFPSPMERIECSMSTSELIAFKVRAHPAREDEEVQSLHFNLGVANTSLEVRCKTC